MNKKTTKFLLTSASAVALLAAYPAVKQSADKAGINFPVITAHASTNVSAQEFLVAAQNAPLVSVINTMNASQLERAGLELRSARAKFNSLAMADQNNATVRVWEGYLSQKSTAAGERFIQLANALPRLSEINGSNATRIIAVRNAYEALPRWVKSTTNVKLWEGYLSQKEAALPQTTRFVQEAYALPNISEINRMNAEEFAVTKQGIRATRATYNSLSTLVKDSDNVVLWEGYLSQKETAVGISFVRDVTALPNVTAIGAMNQETLIKTASVTDEIREAYEDLTVNAKADAEVIRWEDFLTKKEDAIAKRLSELEEEETPLALETVTGLENITVDAGVTELDLPSMVTATLNDADETEVTLDVEWTEDKEYEAGEPGVYTFTYLLTPQEDEELDFELSEDLAEGSITVTVRTILEMATVAVERAEASLLQTDIDAAQGLVDRVIDLVAKAQLQVRLNNLEDDIVAVVDPVNSARNQITLLAALEPFDNVNADYIAEYEDALGTAPRTFETLDEIQTIINNVNDGFAASVFIEEVSELPTVNEISEMTDEELAELRPLLVAARTTYEGLPEGAQTNADVVTSEEALTDLETAVENRTFALEATVFTDEVDALANVSEIRGMNREELATEETAQMAARATYDRLSDGAKALVTTEATALRLKEEALANRVEELDAADEALANATVAVGRAESAVNAIRTIGGRVDAQEAHDNAMTLVKAVSAGEAREALRTRLAVVQTQINSRVFNTTQLNTALADESVETINLTGTYNTISVNRPVTLTGTATVNGKVYVVTDNVVINGLTINATDDYAIELVSGVSNLTVTNNTINSATARALAIYLNANGNGANTITNNTFTGEYSEAAITVDVYATGNDVTTIQNNDFSGVEGTYLNIFNNAEGRVVTDIAEENITTGTY